MSLVLAIIAIKEYPEEFQNASLPVLTMSDIEVGINRPWFEKLKNLAVKQGSELPKEVSIRGKETLEDASGAKLRTLTAGQLTEFFDSIGPKETKGQPKAAVEYVRALAKENRVILLFT
jgi:hypothetical protein